MTDNKSHRVTIHKEFIFEAAHRLPYVPDGHKCKRLHGHSFRVQIHVSGEVNQATGMLIDFAEITKAWAPLDARLNHYFLNEVEGLENPTSENLARWVWEHVAPSLPMLSRVVVCETCTSGCSYSG